MSLLADETPWVMISHSCSSSLCPPLVDPEPLPEPVLGIAARSIADLSRLQDRELAWLVRELDETLHGLKHGLEDCYALLAPIDPGSNLLVSTPRNDLVKGTLTRVGTRIVKGTIHLRLRTLPHQTLTLNPDHPIHVGALSTLHALLTHSIDLITLTLSHASTPYSPNPASPSSPPSPGAAAAFISAQLRLLSQSLADAAVLLRGPPLTDPDPAWTSRSASPSHFDPALPPNVSFHLGVQDSSLVLWLRALEPADAPLNLGMKFALAIGTARRIDHDEADRVFGYCCEGAERTGSPHTPPPGSDNDHGGTGHGFASQDGGKAGGGPPTTQVYVREKVRVETADPSLLSLSAKLSALSHTLALARQNLAAVMGEDIED